MLRPALKKHMLAHNKYNILKTYLFNTKFKQIAAVEK